MPALIDPVDKGSLCRSHTTLENIIMIYLKQQSITLSQSIPVDVEKLRPAIVTPAAALTPDVPLPLTCIAIIYQQIVCHGGARLQLVHATN